MRELYAIRRKSDGFYLPDPKGYMGRGGSFMEPVDCSGNNQNPRLFVSERSAKSALTQWLRGLHTPEYEYDDYDGSTYTAGAYVVPQPHRKKEDMEIVKFTLIPAP